MIILWWLCHFFIGSFAAAFGFAGIGGVFSFIAGCSHKYPRRVGYAVSTVMVAVMLVWAVFRVDAWVVVKTSADHGFWWGFAFGVIKSGTSSMLEGFYAGVQHLNPEWQERMEAALREKMERDSKAPLLNDPRA